MRSGVCLIVSFFSSLILFCFKICFKIQLYILIY
jgi:hypothetical protein